MTKGAPQPRVQTPTYTRVECLNLNANTHTAAVIFHRGPVGKTHTRINLQCAINARVGLTFPIASVDILYCTRNCRGYTNGILYGKYTHETEHYRGRYNIMVSSMCLRELGHDKNIYAHLHFPEIMIQVGGLGCSRGDGKFQWPPAAAAVAA